MFFECQCFSAPDNTGIVGPYTTRNTSSILLNSVHYIFYVITKHSIWKLLTYSGCVLIIRSKSFFFSFIKDSTTVRHQPLFYYSGIESIPRYPEYTVFIFIIRCLPCEDKVGCRALLRAGL